MKHAELVRGVNAIQYAYENAKSISRIERSAKIGAKRARVEWHHEEGFIVVRHPVINDADNIPVSRCLTEL